MSLFSLFLWDKYKYINIINIIILVFKLKIIFLLSNYFSFLQFYIFINCKLNFLNKKNINIIFSLIYYLFFVDLSKVCTRHQHLNTGMDFMGVFTLKCHEFHKKNFIEKYLQHSIKKHKKLSVPCAKLKSFFFEQ